MRPGWDLEQFWHKKEYKEEKGSNIVALVSRTLTDVETKDVARQSEKHFLSHGVAK